MIKPLLSLIGLLSLAGCAAIDYNTVPVESASPPNAEQMSKCPAILAPGKSCTARVLANQWASPIGVQSMDQDESYCFAVLPNQVWYDASRRNTPPYGEKGSWIMNLVKKRHEATGFFSLMVDVQSQSATGETARPIADLRDGPYTTKGPGPLVLYPNDAIGTPNDREYYYKNNSGYIWVTITRCDPTSVD